MKSDGTNVPKLNLEQAKKASDHNAIDLQELLPNPWFTSKDGMRKAKLNIQQKQDQENQDKYDANLIDKSIKKSMKEDVDYQLARKDNQSIVRMMKKVKNSFSSSPVAALVFQPKNLNQHLEDNPSAAIEGEDKKNPFDVSTDKETNLTDAQDKRAKTKALIKETKIKGLSA